MTTTDWALLLHYDAAYCDVTQSDHDYNVAVRDSSLSNVNLVGEKKSCQTTDMPDIFAKVVPLPIEDQVPFYKTNFTWLNKVSYKFDYLGMSFIFRKADTAGRVSNVKNKYHNWFSQLGKSHVRKVKLGLYDGDNICAIKARNHAHSIYK